MTDCAEELEAATRKIDPASLQAAKTAVVAGCGEQLRWIEMFSRSLEAVKPSDLHRFARALALTMLGHLPTRPGTCPFCIQYGSDRSCLGCGYALTHGRCDSDDSAFSLFIEAFQELGRAIYQDTGDLRCPPGKAKQLLRVSLMASAEASKQLLADLPSASTLGFMERKAAYLDRMIALVPFALLSEDARDKGQEVQKLLENYW
jgi:hypothetical protein